MKKIGLALGSGGARGYAHIGVLKVLRDHNIPVHYVSGSSMGAVVAAYYALFEEVEKMEKLALSFTKKELLKYIDFNNPSRSLIRGKKVRKFLDDLYKKKSFSDTKIPLRIPATEVDTGKSFVFEDGKLIDAVMASACFPGVFPVQEYQGRKLFDGGLANAVPVDLVAEADVIIGVDLYNLEQYGKVSYDTRGLIEQAYRILVSRLSHYREKEYDANIIMLKPKIGKTGETFAFYDAKENIKAGVEEAQRHISRIEELVR